MNAQKRERKTTNISHQMNDDNNTSPSHKRLDFEDVAFLLNEVLPLVISFPVRLDQDR